MKIRGLDLPENCTITFHEEGVKVSVSLNVPRELGALYPRKKIFAGLKRVTYFETKEVPLQFVTPKNLNEVYRHLLVKAMRFTRSIKQRSLKAEQKRLKPRELKF